MGRKKGSKNKERYPNTDSTMAVAVSRSALPKRKIDSQIQLLTDCTSCPVRVGCLMKDKVISDRENPKIKFDDKTQCPLFMTYKESIVNVLKNPLIELAKDIGNLEVKKQMQQAVDGTDGKIITPEFVKCMELKLKAAKVYNDIMSRMDRRGVNRGTTQMLNDEDVLDITPQTPGTEHLKSQDESSSPDNLESTASSVSGDQIELSPDHEPAEDTIQRPNGEDC